MPDLDLSFYETFSYESLKSLLETSIFYDPDDRLTQRLQIANRDLSRHKAIVDQAERSIALRKALRELLEKKRGAI